MGKWNNGKQRLPWSKPSRDSGIKQLRNVGKLGLGKLAVGKWCLVTGILEYWVFELVL
jgi:hypothetical protein